jgi:hypothetical protein
MRTNSLFITAALLLGSALPAVADHGRPNEIVPSRRAIQIDELQPQSGGVGSLVTIRGRGLNEVEYVLVGGYKATPEHIGAYEVSFRIPRQHGDGSIALYVPGRGNLAVGRFTVFSLLAVEGLSPRSGKAGTEVQILGSGFQHGDQVFMNDRPLAVQHLDANRIIVRIPASAYTDHLTVVRHGGVSERTAERFQVLQAKPQIYSVSPQGGLPGTEVRITGESFGSGCKVFYGQEKLPVLRYGRHSPDSPNSLLVRIPEDAQNDAFLYVNCAGEQGRSPQRFQLARHSDLPGLPQLEAVQPQQGMPGTRVVLRGHKMKQVDRVLLHGMVLPIVARRGRELEVEIPHGARSGAIALEIRGQLQPTAFRFHVTHAQARPGVEIHEISPGRVLAGDTVTIRGLGFDPYTRVFWGRHELQVVRRSRNGERLEVLAPAHARGTDYLYIDHGSGRTQTDESLEILPPSYSYQLSVRGKLRIGS